MANTGYENFVLESRLTDLLNTKMDTRSFMTIDDSLEGVPGMKKTINVYTFTGQVEKLEKGSGNSDRGAVSFSKKDYKVELEQQAFDYFDEEFMMDPNIVDMGLQGSAQLMINAANTKFFEELAKASLEHQYSDTLKYDDIVDAIALMKLEDESGLFLVIGTDLKAVIRKDAEFKSARQGEIIYNGQIGSIAGIPVVVSKIVEEGAAFITTKKAVTHFVKKKAEVAQERDEDKRKNSVYNRRVGLIALTDATQVVKITSAEMFSAKKKK